MFLDRLTISEIIKKTRDFFAKTKQLETKNCIFLSIEKHVFSMILDLPFKKMVICILFFDMIISVIINSDIT